MSAPEGRESITPTRRWRGRVLPRPEDELVDQGLGFDVETLLNRRVVLRALGLGAATLGLAACGDGSSSRTSSTPSTSSIPTSSSSSTTSSASTSQEIPDETAGPYPGDGSNGPDALNQSGIVRSDIRSSFGGATGTAAGVPMTLRLRITDLAKGGAGFAGVAVYVWHCNRDGGYSMYSSGIENENYLRGVQIADANGEVTFHSIFPACYSGRWPHIHFEVYPDQASIPDASNAVATSQVALPENVCRIVYAEDGYDQSVQNLSQISLSSDSVFGDDGGTSQLATVSGSVEKGYLVSLTAGVDTTTEPTSGSVPGGPPPAGAPSR